jgi:hypothetical protein
MGLTVKQRGHAVATFRFIEARLMEMLAAWVPTTPEMEAKLLFGAHIWDAAQAADALGKRTYELRLPLQHSRAPVAAYQQVLDGFAGTNDAPRRIAVFYDVVLPGLAARYRRYLGATDTLMDAPTVRVIERILDPSARMIREADELRNEIPALRIDDRAWLEQASALESGIAELVAEESAAEGARQAA